MKFIFLVVLSRRSRLLTDLLCGIILFLPLLLRAEPVAVHHLEGTVHGFLALSTMDSKILAPGDLIQVIRGNQVVSRLVFRFKDGSLDDETAIFTQRGSLRLVSDHHIQKGPAFPHPMDVLIHGLYRPSHRPLYGRSRSREGRNGPSRPSPRSG